MLEARQPLGVGGDGHLQRDVAAEPRIVRSIHLTHAAGTERSDDLVGTDPGARMQHWRERGL